MTTTTAQRHLLLNMTANGSLTPQSKDLFVVRHGEGPYVDDAAGNRFIDGLSGLYCCQIGYSYGDEIAEAAQKQLRELCYSPLWSDSAHPTGLELAERLADLAPDGIEHVFFSGGGAEAVETAWKIARRYHTLRGEPGRIKAIARRGAYHGLTLGALSFTDDPGLTEPYGQPAVETHFVANTSHAALAQPLDEAAFTEYLLADVEATVLAAGPESVGDAHRGTGTEPGRLHHPTRRLLGGPAPTGRPVRLPAGRRRGDHRVRPGGEWFGGECYGARPDIVTVAKGITAGYAPMGATLVADHVAEVINQPGEVLNHGYTFSGHPLSAAIALRSLEIMERDRILKNAEGLQDHLAARMASLADLPIVGDVRGAGFFYACELVGDQEVRRLRRHRPRRARGRPHPSSAARGRAARLRREPRSPVVRSRPR